MDHGRMVGAFLGSGDGKEEEKEKDVHGDLE